MNEQIKTREDLERILNGRRLVVSVSGGKDSTACCLHLMELGYEPHEYDRIFFDTGWEHPYLYDYIREDLPNIVGPVDTLRAEVEIPEELEETAREFERELGVEYSSMVRLVLRKGTFPSRVRRFCTESLKVSPAKQYLRGVAGGVVNVVGIRAEESSARAMMTEWEFAPAFDCDTWRPLIDWPVEKVIAIHQRHGVKPCRLYLEQNADRVGCYPCIYSRKAEIRSMGMHSPERVDLIERLELVVKGLAEKRCAAKGETLETIGAGDPGWFQTPRRTKRDDGSTTGEPWPIREVVKWSRTSRGGHVDQLELFTDPVGHQGCVRWGMCDTGSE
tara:strand:- start:40 stop:1035 length:996 start_codon:yes stop_codon:yes gene_type:complete